MKKILSVLKEDNIACGYLYFYIHFIVEIVCFFYLTRISNSMIVWLVPFLYDAFAFVPQSIIGYISDKYPKVKMGIIGVILLFIGISIFSFINVSKLKQSCRFQKKHYLCTWNRRREFARKG